MSIPSKPTETPNCVAPRALSATSAACSRALVGMQPRCRQVPPSLSDSTRITDSPSSEARIAAEEPPDPPPRITTAALRLVISLLLVSCPRDSLAISGEGVDDLVRGLVPDVRAGVFVPCVHPWSRRVL